MLFNSIVYKNGSTHTIEDYADMAIRTASKRAYLMGEGNRRAEWGIRKVVVNSRIGACPRCGQYVGKVFIDDVYSGGSKADGGESLLSEAIRGGLFHPRCKDSTSTYFEGITTLKPMTEEEMEEMDRREKEEARQAYHEREAEKNQRIADNSLDPDNKKTYAHRAAQHRKKAEEIAEKPVANSGESGIIKSKKYYSGFSDTLSTIKGWVKDKTTPAKYKPVDRAFLSSLPKLGSPDNIESALKRANPSGDVNNCQRCVPAYEMRRRGYDVVAKRAPVNPNDDEIGLYNWRNVFVNSDWKSCIGSGKEEIISFLNQCDDGARVEVAITTSEGSHLFVAEKTSSNIIFIDPQTNMSGVERYFEKAESGATKYCRIDNLDLSNLIRECIEVNST